MNIIAVDDERLALQALLDAIKKADSASSIAGFLYAEDALEFAEANLVDVAFLDVEMADISGVELARRLKRINPDINIIFATGFGEYRDSAFELHASGYLTKPITEEKVKKELAELRSEFQTKKAQWDNEKKAVERVQKLREELQNREENR